MRSDWVIACPVLMGLMTLFIVNFHQYRAQAGLIAASVASPTVMLAFNLIVAFAYAVFFGIILWKRKDAVCRAQ